MSIPSNCRWGTRRRPKPASLALVMIVAVGHKLIEFVTEGATFAVMVTWLAYSVVDLHGLEHGQPAWQSWVHCAGTKRARVCISSPLS